MNYEILTEAALAALAQELPEWSVSSDALLRHFRFPDFPTAMAFIASAVPHINKLDHHPEWSNVYDRVSVTLRTHAVGNKVTNVDRDLARVLEELARSVSA